MSYSDSASIESFGFMSLPEVVRHLSIVWLVTLLTRIPMLGIAEPDSALFATGVVQWMRGGPQNLSIYSAQVCGVYYATIVTLLRSLRLHEQDAIRLMSIVSLLACLAMVTFVYLVGERFVGPVASFTGTLLFALSPGLWWISAEPHPQMLALAFAMASVWCFCNYLETAFIWYALGSVACLSIAISLKIDAVLGASALLAVALWLIRNGRSAIAAVAVGGWSFLLSTGISRLVAAASNHMLRAGRQSAGIFAQFRTPYDVAIQLSPILFGLGAVTVIAASIAFLASRQKLAEKWFSFGVIAIWCVPGYLFWTFISGNNVRHVVFFGIPLFWIAGSFLKPRYAVLALVASLLIPANSDTGIMPSPNVPGSALILSSKKKQMDDMATSLSEAPSCFTGSYTNDYIVNTLLRRGATVLSQISPDDVATSAVTLLDGGVVSFRQVISSQRTLELGSCLSLEFPPDGRRVHFLGNEWGFQN